MIHFSNDLSLVIIVLKCSESAQLSYMQFMSYTSPTTSYNTAISCGVMYICQTCQVCIWIHSVAGSTVQCGVANIL